MIDLICFICPTLGLLRSTCLELGKASWFGLIGLVSVSQLVIPGVIEA